MSNSCLPPALCGAWPLSHKPNEPPHFPSLSDWGKEDAGLSHTDHWFRYDQRKRAQLTEGDDSLSKLSTPLVLLFYSQTILRTPTPSRFGQEPCARQSVPIRLALDTHKAARRSDESR
ncbi:hypothetical protein DPEC_G00174520 [Dallia pectoralis]|uniref:Uncharacterized protein n=1 Tax=Dallia pectoralis TaxID=75939 RepID=A0ACC2GEQ0_DALPE|nr:hypothetical protein DPEC_G00174520 [Dallia pectoralis]